MCLSKLDFSKVNFKGLSEMRMGKQTKTNFAQVAATVAVIHRYENILNRTGPFPAEHTNSVA